VVLKDFHNCWGVKDLVSTGAGRSASIGAVKLFPVLTIKDDCVVNTVYEDDVRAIAKVKLSMTQLLNCTNTICGVERKAVGHYLPANKVYELVKLIGVSTNIFTGCNDVRITNVFVLVNRYTKNRTFGYASAYLYIETT
jgi:hypothetical protein